MYQKSTLIATALIITLIALSGCITQITDADDINATQNPDGTWDLAYNPVDSNIWVNRIDANGISIWNINDLNANCLTLQDGNTMCGWSDFNAGGSTSGGVTGDGNWISTWTTFDTNLSNQYRQYYIDINTTGDLNARNLCSNGICYKISDLNIDTTGTGTTDTNWQTDWSAFDANMKATYSALGNTWSWIDGNKSQIYPLIDGNISSIYPLIDGNASGGIGKNSSAGQINFDLNANTITGDNNLYWDNTNKRLGIGTTSPSTSEHILGNGTTFGTNLTNTLLELQDTSAVGVGNGGALALGGYYTGTTVGRYAGIKGGKENATNNDYASYLGLFTRANGGALTEFARLTSEGKFIVSPNLAATAAAGVKAVGSNIPGLQVYGNNSAGLVIISAQNSGISPAPFFSTRGYRGTIAAPTATQAGDEMLRAFGGGWGTTFDTGGLGGFKVQAEAALTDTSMPSYVSIYTTPVNGTSATTKEQLRVDSAGRVGIGMVPAQQLDVNKTQDALTGVQVTNVGTTSGAFAGFQGISDTANVFTLAHSTGRTVQRYGTTIGGFSELLTTAGNGLLIGTGTVNAPIIFGTNSTEVLRLISGQANLSGDLNIGVIGKTISLKSGANACIGRATLVSGGKTVTTSCSTTSSYIFVQDLNKMAIPTESLVVSKTGSGSFDVNSTDGADTSEFNWIILKEN